MIQAEIPPTFQRRAHLNAGGCFPPLKCDRKGECACRVAFSCTDDVVLPRGIVQYRACAVNRSSRRSQERSPYRASSFLLVATISRSQRNERVVHCAHGCLQTEGVALHVCPGAAIHGLRRKSFSRMSQNLLAECG
jgi:hypothetical protein